MQGRELNQGCVMSLWLFNMHMSESIKNDLGDVRGTLFEGMNVCSFLYKQCHLLIKTNIISREHNVNYTMQQEDGCEN